MFMLMNKNIVYSASARKALEKGMSVLVKAVRPTLGPKGRNIILSTLLGPPYVTNDGVTIVKEIELSNKLENIGVLLLRQVILKTNDMAGDGTTTAAILTHSVVSQGIKAISAGLNPVLVKKGVKKAACFVIEKLTEYSRPVNSISDIISVASVSAGNDDCIGLTIAEAIKKVGREGVILLEEGCSSRTLLEISEGMTVNHGFMSHRFLRKSDEAEICQDNPFVLLTDQKITHVHQELIYLLEQVASLNRSLLIVARDISQEVLAMLAMNRSKEIIDVVAVRLPESNTSSQILEDFAILTGTKVLSKNLGLTLSDVSLDNTGSAKRIVVSKYETKIISAMKHRDLCSHCYQISKQLDLTTDHYEKEKLRTRLSKLQGGVAVIRIGAHTDTEVKYKKLRFEDAINTTKAAIDEGILPGGGAALVHLAKRLSKWANQHFLPEELVGMQIVSNALSAPLAIIAENNGLNGESVVEQVKNVDFPMGYDASKGLMVDMYENGVIDSAKVIRLAIQNSLSIASIILTTECIISDKLID